jgi:hypothetical protein
MGTVDNGGNYVFVGSGNISGKGEWKRVVEGGEFKYDIFDTL